MLTQHAELVAGNGGSVVWFNDLLMTSVTNHMSGEQNLVQIDGHPRKVVIINEGAADAVGLLGKIGFIF